MTRELLEHMGAEQIEVIDGRTVDFYMAGLPGTAYLREGGAQIRGSLFLAVDHKLDGARAWVARQPKPGAAVLEVAKARNEEVMRLLFERPADLEASAQPDGLLSDALIYGAAWARGEDVHPWAAAPSFPSYLATGAVRRAPENAWILTGDDASFPTAHELSAQRHLAERGIFETTWTVAKHTVPGDLLLVYFLAPRKALCFAARAVSHAYFDRDAEVAAIGAVAREQWWAATTPLVPLPEVPYARLRELAGGHLIMRGRSGHFVRPEFVSELRRELHTSLNAEQLNDVLPVPVGCADLPSSPSSIGLEQWRELAAGAFRLEQDVERYVVEPLIDMALAAVKSSAKPHKSYAIGRQVADYVVVHQQVPTCVVEVKLRVREPRDGTWQSSPDFRQVRGYAASLSTPAALVDTNQIYLIDTASQAPRRVIDRRSMTELDLRDIGEHLVRG